MATTVKNNPDESIVERVQTGVRLEKRLLKVLKGMAEYHDMTLGDLIEGIVLHTFDGKPPFDHGEREKIADFKAVYGLDLDASARHHLREGGNGQHVTHWPAPDGGRRRGWPNERA